MFCSSYLSSSAILYGLQRVLNMSKACTYIESCKIYGIHTNSRLMTHEILEWRLLPSSARKWGGKYHHDARLGIIAIN
jgi:hypothetical protein